MKYKVKKALCVLLIFSVIITLCPFEAPKKAKAATTGEHMLEPILYKEHLFTISYTKENDELTFYVYASRLNSDSKNIVYPGLETIRNNYPSEFSNWDSTTKKLNAEFSDNCNSSAVRNIIFESEYSFISGESVSQFPNATSLTIHHTDTIVFNEKCFNSAALNSINLDANIVILKGMCFASNTNLNNFEFSGSAISIFGGSNFRACDQLKNVKLTANGIYIQGGLNFALCPNLSELTLAGNTEIDNSVADFSGIEKATINFSGSLSTSDSIFTTHNATVNITGYSNYLGEGFINGGSVDNLVIAGHYDADKDTNNSHTVFASGAINNATVSSFEIKSAVTFADKTLQNTTINDLVIAVDNRDGNKNITYESAKDRMGNNSTVTNLTFANNDNCKELNNFPLGGGTGDAKSTSLNIENIYFKNRNFKYIDNSSYGRSKAGTTHVYGYGGGIAWNSSKEKITAYTMFTDWCAENNCEFNNYDYLVTKLPDIAVYLDGTGSFTYDSKLVVKIAHLNEDGSNPNYEPSPLYFTDKFDQATASNNYHIFVPATGTVNKQEQIVYTYTDPEDKTKTNYIISNDSSYYIHETGNFLLFAEVCGTFYPFHVIVGECSIQSINDVSPKYDHALDLNVGEEVTADMLDVEVTYTNGKTGYATSSEYRIEHPVNGIQEGANTCSVILLNQNVTGERQKTFAVTGYPDEATDFTIRCNKTNDDGTIILNEGSVLKSSEQKTAAAILTLDDISYVNPYKESEPVTEGFKFIVGNQELDTYKISVGQNDVKIRYKSLEKTISIYGAQADIKSISAEYIGNGAYEGFTEIPLSDIRVTITRENNTSEIVKNTSLYRIESDYIIKRNENNYLTVTYTGTTTSKNLTAQICVKGLPNTVKDLINVVYEGSDLVGTKVNLNDFNFSIVMDSGEVISSATAKAIKANLSFKETDEIELHEGNNFFRIYYEDVANNKFVSSKVTIIGVANGSTPGIDSTPDTNPDKDPTTVTVTETPNTSGHTATAVPNVTPTATPLPVSKGKTYTVKNIKYKVLSFNGKSGTVTATGYSKSAKSIAVANYVYIKGYKFTVKSISNNAFKNCSSLKGTVNINGSISKIGNNAFIGCKKIKKIVIGKNITSVGSKAFYNCKSLSFVDLRQAKSLKKIGASSFKKNKKGRLFKVKPSTKQYFIYLLKGKY